MDAEAARGAAVGSYPVDILEDDPEGLLEAALAYYATLGDGAGPSQEVFSLPSGEQVKLEASSVCFCTVHRDEPQHKILVLVNPQDTKTVVAVYIKGSWWPTEDVLRTSDPAREGLMKVQSFGERIILFILNVIIFGRLERNLDADDMFFLPHSVKEQAKILWRNGAAVGFYTTKTKGSLCGNGSAARYVLPVFDTVFVRRQHRRQGLGMALLQDFCETFREDEALGVSWPISSAMFQVCRKFLLACPEERGRLWEVEPPGAWGQRVNIWLKIQLQQCRLPECGDRKSALELMDDNRDKFYLCAAFQLEGLDGPLQHSQVTQRTGATVGGALRTMDPDYLVMEKAARGGFLEKKWKTRRMTKMVERRRKRGGRACEAHGGLPGALSGIAGEKGGQEDSRGG